MSRVLCVAFVVVVVGLITAQSVLADEVRCEGSILSIDGENVTVKDAMKEHPMKLEPGTKITSGGKPVMVADLKVGQKVKCWMEKRGDEMVCKAMELVRDTP